MNDFKDHVKCSLLKLGNDEKYRELKILIRQCFKMDEENMDTSLDLIIHLYCQVINLINDILLEDNSNIYLKTICGKIINRKNVLVMRIN